MTDPQLKRGMLDTCVLAALAGEDSYGYKIIRDLSECVAISESTLYPILKRLESNGSLRVYSVEHNGRLRKFYHLTDAGRAKIPEFLEDFGEILKIHNFIVKRWNHE
jgi:PadR family transcriptional regulator PadR